jgi:hypothetical protein
LALSSAEKLALTTVRLECRLADGRTSTGTSFFFSFKIDDQKIVPLLITNKHVINGATSGTFVLTLRNESGDPVMGSYEPITFNNFETMWIKHPDDGVDLAVFPLGPLLNQAEQLGKKFFFAPLDESLIPTDQVLASLTGIDDITMIGYPDGIWDQRNNMPIVRRGITATNPKHDYNGLPIFVIDCACFPGSSGSPVVIFNQGAYADASGGIVLGGGRVLLLGVLFAGPQHVVEGEIQTIEVPLQNLSISMSKIPNNLGFVVKAQKICDFKADLMART